jgi:tetratricopeptide (TPR) repeat protein
MQHQGRVDEAGRLFETILRASPDHFDALHNLGVIRLRQGKIDDARLLLRKALYLRPHSADAQNNLALVYQAKGRLDLALAALEKAIAARPGFAEAMNNLGVLLAQMDRHDEAIPVFAKALDAHPDYIDARRNLGLSLAKTERFEEAIAQFEMILAKRPGDAGACRELGVLLQTIGDSERARALLEKAVALAPRTAAYFHELGWLKRYAPDDPHLAMIGALANDIGALPQQEQIELHFSLAKIAADLGEHDRAFRHLHEGNALKRRETPYDEAATLGRLRRIREVFTANRLARRCDAPTGSDPVPVFIVGMPRSGSTLVEQILATHSHVVGGGERKDLDKAIASVWPGGTGAIDSPDALGSATEAQLNALAAEYLKRLRAAAPTAPCVTDKLPANFAHLGLIHLALPNARIIHTRRDPLDTCFSCYSILFHGHQPFAYHLAELGRYYRAYDRLMAHWRATLPRDVLLEVEYERVVDDLEGEARRIVAHCGLAWEPACVEFYRTRRPIQTASSAQVRQPIYRASLGRAQHYEKFLQPLRDALQSDPA